MVQPGATVAGHRVEALLGDDAMGAIWKVRGPSGEPRVLRTLLLSVPAFQERFRRAAELLITTEHPNLVRVHEVLEVEGRPAALVEWVDGGHLGGWIARGPHPPAAIVAMLHGILSGVSAAHEIGLLHRNLKPSKVLLAGTVPKVDDFALGKVTVEDGDLALTQMGTTFGTPQYMPPEQFRGAALVGETGDLWSVGCLAYEMCAGARAFDGADLVDIYAAVASGAYPPLAERRPDLPEALVQLIGDLLQVIPDDRPPSARAALERITGDPTLAALLEAARRGPPTISAPPPPAGTPPSVGRSVEADVATAPPASARRLARIEAEERQKRVWIVAIGAVVALLMLLALAALLALR